MSNDNLTFGGLIKLHRRKLRLTQEETAKHAKISKSYLSAIENNRIHHPSPSVIKDLAASLSLDEDQLFSLIDNERKPELENGQFTLIGDYITYKRKRKGLKQVDLAKLSGLTSGYISLIENNLKKPRMRTFKKIARVLDIPDKELLKYIDKDTSKKETLLVDVTGLEQEDINFLKDQINYLKNRAQRKK